MTVPVVDMRPGHVYYLGPAQKPTLELEPNDAGGGEQDLPAARGQVRVAFSMAAEGRQDGEVLWTARLPERSSNGPIRFRIDLGAGRYDGPPEGGFYETGLETLWVQDRQLFNYQPATSVSESRVLRIDGLPGSRRPRRKIYVYLPRGYDDHSSRSYPVLYMQDGQNVFEAFQEDSYVGSWQADTTADRLIGSGQMRECVIVGISHGGARRIAEYLPPGMKIRARKRLSAGKSPKAAGSNSEAPRWITGAADSTFAYYQNAVAEWVRRQLRISAGREDTAVCGSSMGGLFTLYVAFRHAQFARHYAALSPSLALPKDENGRAQFFDLLQVKPRPDIRLWLDSGTLDAPGRGDDGLAASKQAHRILLERGFIEGEELHFQIDQGGMHHEEAWARRLPDVFRYLFPAA